MRDLNTRSNAARAMAPLLVTFCDHATAAIPGSGNRTLPPNWVVSACISTSTADTIPAAAVRCTCTVSVPDHASATQWMVTISSRPRRPSDAHDCCDSAAGSAASLSGSVRPTYSDRGALRAVTGGPSYTVTGAVVLAPRVGSLANRVTR